MEERATRVAKFAAGVSQPLRSGPSAADKLATDLARLIQNESSGHVRELVVEVHPECVVLAGRAPSFYHKQLAQHAVMKHLGDRHLENRIEVVWSASAFLD
jgi:osmotically-inducible protein OsmY